MRLLSQLIKSISKVFQKLLKYFNGTAILIFFVLPSSGYFLLSLPWIWMIKNLLKRSLVHLYNITISFLMFLNNYRYIWLNYTLASQHQYLLHDLLVCYLFHLCNQWVYFSLCNYFSSSFVCSFCYIICSCLSVTTLFVIVPLASMFASL